MKKLLLLCLILLGAVNVFAQEIETSKDGCVGVKLPQSYNDVEGMKKAFCVGRQFDRVVTGTANKALPVFKFVNFECDDQAPYFLLAAAKLSPDVTEVLQDVALRKGHKITMRELQYMITSDPDVAKLLAIKEMYFQTLKQIGNESHS